jgi:hypothetical protein
VRAARAQLSRARSTRAALPGAQHARNSPGRAARAHLNDGAHGVGDHVPARLQHDARPVDLRRENAPDTVYITDSCMANVLTPQSNPYYITSAHANVPEVLLISVDQLRVVRDWPDFKRFVHGIRQHGASGNQSSTRERNARSNSNRITITTQTFLGQYLE